MSKPTDTEKAQAVAQELRELLREARGTLGDIRTELRNARGLYDSLAREQIDRVITEGNARLREQYDESLRSGAARITESFERIERIMIASGLIPRAGAADEELVIIGGAGALGPTERARHVRQSRTPQQKGKRT